MKRWSLLVALAFSAGCSNAPIAGFLDCVAPSKAKPGAGGDRPPAGGDWGPTVPPGPPVPRSDALPPPALP